MALAMIHGASTEEEATLALYFKEEGRNLQEELRELGHAMDTVESIRLELEEMTEGSWRR